MLLACAAGPTAREPEVLPVFTAEEAALFDDTFSGEVFDVLSASTDSRERESKLAERTARADSVVPVKIATVTSDRALSTTYYHLELVPVGPTLAGKPPPNSITIDVAPANPSYQLVRAADATLVGKRLILFARTYEVDGREMIHWRAEADTPAVRYAITRATALRGARRDGSASAS